MVVVMEEGATEEQVQNVVAHLVEQGFDVHRSTGAQRTVLGAVGAGRHGPSSSGARWGARSCSISEPYKLAVALQAREHRVRRRDSASRDE